MAVVLITGCRSAIGFETALPFGRCGDRVYATTRDAARGNRFKAVAPKEGVPIVVESLDVVDGDAVTTLVARIAAAEEPIDVLVNNAGIPGAMATVDEIDEAVGRAVLKTNFWALFRLCRPVIPRMRTQGSDVIVNVSTFGVQLAGRARTLSFYSVSKHCAESAGAVLQAEVAINPRRW